MSFLRSILFVLLISLLTVSCSTLKKVFGGGDDDIEDGSDIISKNIDGDAVGSDSGNISGLSTVFFAYDSSSLSNSTKEQLKQNAEWIQNTSNVSRVELEGHCDSMGSEAYNIGLGLRRAQTVKTFLISLGISEDRFSIVSYGEERPLSEDNSRNRRVNFVPIY